MKTYGYTIVELLVVVTVLVLLTSFGLAGYNTYNQNETLNQAALSVESALREAQNRALTGEKVCKNSLGANVCQVDPGCGDNNDKVLTDWSVVITNNTTYTQQINCASTTSQTKSATLPLNIQFKVIGSFPQTVSFLPLGQRSAAASTITIKHTGLSQCIDVFVTVTGDTSRSAPYSTSC